MIHHMLDLETLGTAPNSAILQIGLARFDPAGSGIDDTFERTISLDSCLQAGLKIDGDTFAWWLTQSEAARRAVIYNPQPLTRALIDLTAWLGYINFQQPENVIWSHGAAFDVPILASAYRACGYKEPWDHRLVRDTRTLFWLAEQRGWEKPKRETAHTALADAVAQAEDVQSACRYLEDRR